MVSKELTDELGVILQEEFLIRLPSPTLSRLANDLVAYFQQLSNLNSRGKNDKKS